MTNQNDIEQINRLNFRASLEALSRPGQIQKVQPLFESTLQAMASLLLYSEVSYWYRGDEDFQMIQAVCGAQQAPQTSADYLFYDFPDKEAVSLAKGGSSENPEMGATLIFKCDLHDAGGTALRLSGPGIKKATHATLPVDTSFIEELKVKNEVFPMGVDLFFISEKGQLLGIPRTTQIEVVA